MERLVIQNNDDIRLQIKKYFSDNDFKSRHPIGTWDVSRVTNMSKLFNEQRDFNESINGWDVSKVTTMQAMFAGCRRFNQPLDKWNMSKVTNISSMFERCIAFNQPLNSWNVSKVTSMIGTFNVCDDFNQPLNNWNVSKVTKMDGLFNGCSAFNQPLDNWNVSKVANMSHMFSHCFNFNQPLNSWNVSNVTNMSGMFGSCRNFNQPLDKWDVSNVKKMETMFILCVKFNQSLESWTVNPKTSVFRMLQKATSFNQPLSVSIWNAHAMDTNLAELPYTDRIHIIFGEDRPDYRHVPSGEPPAPLPEEAPAPLPEEAPAPAPRQRRTRRARIVLEQSPEPPAQLQEAPRRPLMSRIAANAPNTLVLFDLKANTTCLDLIDGEIPMKQAIQGENTIFVFYTNDINASQRVSVPTSRVKEAIKDDAYYVYACKTPDRMQSVMKGTKYFNIKKLTGFGDVVLLDDMKEVATHSMMYLFVFKQTNQVLVTTASHDAVYGARPNYVGDRHCQQGQSAQVYQLMRNVKHVCGSAVPPSGGKHRRRRTRTRRTRHKKRSISARHRRASL